MAPQDALRVLVVDDEPVVRASVARVLKGHRLRLPGLEGEVGFLVEAVETAEAGLQRIADDPPQLLLLDYKLPGLDGLEALARLPRGGEMLTVMITAYASVGTAVTAMKLGAYDFLVKPFSPEELRAVVGKAAERILLARQAQRLVREKQQARYQLTALLTHELKTPLAAVESFIRFLLWNVGQSPPEQQQEMLERSLVRLAGMRSMILDLLDLTRIESGTRERTLGPVDVEAVARRVLETVQPLAGPRKIVLTLHGGPLVLRAADEGEIEIILGNLISNAVKYNRDGGRVDVTLGREGPAATLAVTDTGIGLAPEEAARLFQEFVRIKNERTREIAGSGLGLSIVRRLAQLYGGEARVESTPGQGSTFTVTLKDEPEELGAPGPA